mmetsp:Transcript_16740/g.35524  ORF Transcript_16740/g.35524 Transcript_16740/m.35524 type:complete len:202 (+) Transcript_16740:216-821(+)
MPTTSMSPREQSCRSACVAAARTAGSVSPSASALAAHACASPRVAKLTRASNAAARTIAGATTPFTDMSGKRARPMRMPTASGSPFRQRRRRVAKAVRATCSSLSCSPAAAAAMPLAPPSASVCAMSSRAAQRTSTSPCLETTNAKSSRNPVQLPRGLHIVRKKLNPASLNEVSGSVMAASAARMLLTSPRTARACSASAA